MESLQRPEGTQEQKEAISGPQEEARTTAGNTLAPLDLSKLTLSQMLQIPKVCELYERNARLQERLEDLLDAKTLLEAKVAQLEQELRAALVNVPAPRPISRYFSLLLFYI